MEENEQTSAITVSEALLTTPTPSEAGPSAIAGSTELTVCPPPAPGATDLPIILSLFGVLLLTRVIARIIRRRQGS